MPAAFALPPELAAAAAAELAGRPGRAIRDSAAGLTANYRAGGKSAADMDFGAYLATRLPATYAAVKRVLGELKERLPDFAPQSLVDVGSGPGTASWAAAGLWPELSKVTCVDNNRGFLDLAKRLAGASPNRALAGAGAVAADLADHTCKGQLLIAAYALAECPEDRACEIARKLWEQTEGALVIVEPGTPQGFARVRRARQALIDVGAAIVAPCAHANACPMVGSDWCHFSVRLPRSRLHMQAKAATVPFEDERFSYVIAARLPMPATPARVLAPPDVGKAEVKLKLCAAGGLEMRTVARRDGPAYKQAKKLEWGDIC